MGAMPTSSCTLSKRRAMNKTLRPLFGLAALAFAAHASAQITFYEGEGFRGRTFAANGEVKNFQQTGFNDRASSVVVDRGRWEVCEDARFQGRCVVLRRGSYDSLSGMGMENRISSVRRVADNRQYDNEVPYSLAHPSYEHRRIPNERLREVPVTSARAVMGPPEQRCWVERAQVGEKRDLNVPGAIIGGVLGGILGHQVGGGTGKTVATIGGAVGGGALGAQHRPDPRPAVREGCAPLRERRRPDASVLGRHLQLPGRPAPRADDVAAGPDHHGQQRGRAAPLGGAPRGALQVITDGALRPVRSRTPAIRSAISISDASAACVSAPCRAGSGSKRSR